MSASNTAIGIFSAIGVIFIWSGFIVFSRAGVITELTAFDISALRFLVAGTIVLPFARVWWPRHLPFHAKFILSFCGPGAVYSLLMYLGLTGATAAYAGIFSNGSMPIFTAGLTLVILRQSPGRNQMLAIAVIIVGGLLLGLRGAPGAGANTAGGIVLFLTASAILSAYVFGVKYWQVTPRQALALVTLPNALIFLPVWFFFLPSGLAETDMSMIVFQALFQGLGPGILAVILFALAVAHLGPTLTAGFSAAVPASAAVLAIPVLAEVPSSIEWMGIFTVTVGLIWLLLGKD